MTPSSPTPIRPKSVVVFAAHALALTLLIGWWPTPRERAPALLHHSANAAFELLGSPVRLRAPGPDAAPGVDTWMQRPGPAGPVWTSGFGASRVAWWPCAALVALLLATPMSARRRALALCAGLLGLGFFTLGRLGVEIAYLDYELAHGPGGPTAGLLQLLLRVGSESLTATVPSAAAVLVLWAALARPREALEPGALRGWLGLAPAREHAALQPAGRSSVEESQGGTAPDPPRAGRARDAQPPPGPARRDSR